MKKRDSKSIGLFKKYEDIYIYISRWMILFFILHFHEKKKMHMHFSLKFKDTKLKTVRTVRTIVERMIILFFFFIIKNTFTITENRMTQYLLSHQTKGNFQ